MRAHCLIHYFAGGAVDAAGPTALTPEQAAAVRPPDRRRPAPCSWTPTSRSSPPSPATAAPACPSSPPPPAGRVDRPAPPEHLLRTGALFFDVEVDPVLFGYTARVLLWMSVAPAHLETVGQALPTHPEVVFAAATTGATNLVATVICPDMAGLYDYLTRRIGPLPGRRTRRDGPGPAPREAGRRRPLSTTAPRPAIGARRSWPQAARAARAASARRRTGGGLDRRSRSGQAPPAGGHRHAGDRLWCQSRVRGRPR